MKVVILAGGLGTRLAEETDSRPKPMVEIGGRPLLWHIIKHFAHFGHTEFYIALGYRGEVVKRYFLDYALLDGSMSIDMHSGDITQHRRDRENWTLHLMDTGLYTNTGGRVHRLRPHLEDGPFMVTYGDGVSNLDLRHLEAFHRSHGRLATVTAVRPPSRFGGLIFDENRVTEFSEKPQIGEGWINGGFQVFEPGVFDYLPDDDTSLEADALEHLAGEGHLMAYKHEGFWQCMDTLRDVRLLESMWRADEAPWKVWA